MVHAHLTLEAHLLSSGAGLWVSGQWSVVRGRRVGVGVGVGVGEGVGVGVGVG